MALLFSLYLIQFHQMYVILKKTLKHVFYIPLNTCHLYNIHVMMLFYGIKKNLVKNIKIAFYFENRPFSGIVLPALPS